MCWMKNNSLSWRYASRWMWKLNQASMTYGECWLAKGPSKSRFKIKISRKTFGYFGKGQVFFLLGLWPLLLFVLLSAAVTTTERSAVSGLVTVTLSKVPCAPLWYRSTQLGDEKSNARKEQVAYFSIFPMKNRPGTYVSSENRSSESVH